MLILYQGLKYEVNIIVLNAFELQTTINRITRHVILQ